MRWLSLAFLGGFRARLRSGRPVIVPTRKGQGVLAYLGVRPGQPHSRDKLATLLWGDANDRQAHHNLRQTVFALRRALPRTRPAALIVSGETLALNAATVEVDVAVFERLVAEETPTALAAAAALYEGDFLEGASIAETPFEEWLSGERERLRAMALNAMNTLLDYHSRTDELEAAVRTALRLLAVDPLQERVHRTLMQLHARQGRHGLALRQYQICVDLLHRELGVEPDAETKEAYRALLPAGRQVAATPPHVPARGRAASRGRARAVLPDAEGSLVGREHELRELHGLLANAWRGRGGTALIVGEAGIGKSRLVKDVATTALKRRRQVLFMRCHESEQVLAFGPWVEALRSKLAAHPRALTGLAGVWRAELVRLLPELAEPEYSTLATGDDHLRLFEAITRVVEHLVARRPLVIVMEDVHWADEMTVRLLPFLSRRLQRSPVLVLATARAEDVSETGALARVIEELRRDDRLVTLGLSPLSREESDQLVRDRADPRARAATLARLEEQVWTLSEGNPFMIVEAMRAVGEASTLAATEGLRLPDRIREMIAGRLVRLSERGQDVAGIAALIGREFHFSVVQRAARLSAPLAAEAMEELVRRRILHAVGEDYFDFSHERIREVAGDRLRGPRRKLMHARIAEAIEQQYASDLAPHCGALGWHYRQGDVSDKAVEYLRQAAVQALERSAYRDAVALFKQTLVALEQLPRSRQALELAIDLRLDLRRCLNPLGDSPEILEHLREAERVAEALGDETRTARVLVCLMHELTLRGERAETLRDGERALAISERLGDASLEAAACYFMGEVYQIAGEYRRGAEFFTRSVHATRDDPFPLRVYMSGLPSIVSRAYLTLCLANLGELESARRWAEEAVALAEQAAHPYSLAFAHWALGLVLTAKGELDDAIAVLERAHELCRSRELEQPYGVAPLLGFALALKGRREDGLRLVEAGVRKATASSVRKASAASYIARLADTYVLCGRPADARPLAERALDMARTYGEQGPEAWSLLILAKVAALDPSEMRTSEALHREARARYTALGMSPGLANCHLSLGRLYARWGRRDEARAEMAAASSIYRSIGATVLAVSAEQAAVDT